MAEPDDFYAYTETLNAKRRAAKATVHPTGEVDRGSCGEVVLLKKTEELVDPANVRDGGEVSRS